MNRASIVRAIRGTRWLVERFERLRTKTVVIIHDEQHAMSMAFSLENGGDWAAFLREVRREARKTHDQVLDDLVEQDRLLTAANTE